MKISNRHRSYPRFRGWNVPALDKGPEVETFKQLPPRGHPAYGYFVKDIKEWYRWEKTKGRWVEVGFAAWRVRPMVRNVKDLVVQPMFKQIVNLPILPPFNFGDTGVFSDSMKSLIKDAAENPPDIESLYSLQSIRDRISDDQLREGQMKAVITELSLDGGTLSTFKEIKRPGLSAGRRMLNYFAATYDGDEKVLTCPRCVTVVLTKK